MQGLCTSVGGQGEHKGGSGRARGALVQGGTGGEGRVGTSARGGLVWEWEGKWDASARGCALVERALVQGGAGVGVQGVGTSVGVRVQEALVQAVWGVGISAKEFGGVQEGCTTGGGSSARV